jgi:hypothetical protein
MAPIIQATSAPHVWWALRSKAVSDELWSNYIFVRGQYRSHGEVFRHGSPEHSLDMVFFSSARDNHVVAEAQGHAGYQFPRLSNEASQSSGPVSVHARPWGIPSGVCPKVLATEGTSAHSAQWNCHWDHDQGSSARTYDSILRQKAPTDSGEAASEDGWLHPGWQRFLPKNGGSLQILWDDQGLQRKNPPEACQVDPQLQSERQQRKPASEVTVHLTIFGAIAKLFQAASSKGQRRQGLRRKIWGSTQEDLLLILWWGQGPYYKNVPNHRLEAKGDRRSRSSAESAKPGLAHCFVPLSLHTRICGQSSCNFCCFG